MHIKTSQTIIVNKNVESVFSFFADPVNDSSWRTEINQTTLDGKLQVGVTVFEYSRLSKRAPNNLVELKCTALENNRIAVFETPAGAPFYLKTQRSVKGLSGHSTEPTYTLEYDPAIVKFALGFGLPRFIIVLKTNADRKKYLRQLRALLERS